MSKAISEGLARELEVHANLQQWANENLSRANTFEEYVALSKAGTNVDHARRVSADWPSGARVLDIGFGSGVTTMCLVEKGFDVVGLEPSAACIETAQAAAQKFNLCFSAICATAEDIDGAVDGTFDVVLFHSSLHHCDDPQRALANAYSILRPGGRVTLVEPTLKPWRTNKWFNRQLEEDPVGMGHYGGNEHIYYTWEYQKMLKDANFGGIQWRPVLLYVDVRQMLVDKLTTTIEGRHTFSLSAIAVRTVYYVTFRRIMNSGLLTYPLRLLSLIDGVITGFKTTS